MKAWEKKRKDLALNLSELAEVAGWNRDSLADMCLPLEKGKITYSDFRRVLQRRQDAHEASRKSVKLLTKPAASAVGDENSLRAIADKFDAPSQKHANRAA